MRHLGRTHGVSVAWLHEQLYIRKLCPIEYTESLDMAADIYTKAFTEADKWDHALKLINIINKAAILKMIPHYKEHLATSASRFAKPPKDNTPPDALGGAPAVLGKITADDSGQNWFRLENVSLSREVVPTAEILGSPPLDGWVKVTGSCSDGTKFTTEGAIGSQPLSLPFKWKGEIEYRIADDASVAGVSPDTATPAPQRPVEPTTIVQIPPTTETNKSDLFERTSDCPRKYVPRRGRKKGSVAELFCGSGHFSEAWAEAGYEAHGWDILDGAKGDLLNSDVFNLSLIHI